jgi:hypothetical protein
LVRVLSNLTELADQDRVVSAAGAIGDKMADHWRHATPGADAMRGTGDDEAGYVAGWTISGLATLATILVVWIFAI